MTRTVKALTISAWALAVVAMVSFVASGMWRRGAPEEKKAERFFQVPDFQLVNQDGKPFSGKDVAGKVWIADFVFTQCAGPCPAMTAALAQVQKDLAGTPVQLVTVSVDPANDTPPVLKQHMKDRGLDESNWTFATGKPDEIFGLAKNMKIAASAASEQNTIMHAEKFILIDAEGWIRGYYHYQDQEKMAQLLRDARELVKKG
jgi:cytochrome oxidase Cu insertion factor (SCO1/SenC/PrrC family)